MKDALLVVVGAVLAKLAELLVDAIRKRRSRTSTARIASVEDVVEWGWSGEELLERLIALDHKLIGASLNEEREGTVAQWAPVFMTHSESWKLLVLRPKKIVGYWAVAALKDGHYARALSGELLDSEITTDTIDPLDIPGTYNLYFVLLGVLPNIPRGGEKLVDSFFHELEQLALRGVFFKSICANAFTKDGVRVCDGFGMVKIGDHKDFGVVYWMPMYPWPKKLMHRRWETLRKMYEDFFNLNPTPSPVMPSSQSV